MKSFDNICKMTQAEVKKYMKGYLASKKYEVVDEDGFLYAKGTVPVLLVAHMDTVHKETPKTITFLNHRISSPQGIGGDDRCGVFIIMNLVKELHCSVLLCEDEEIGCIGAHKFTKATYKDTDEAGNTVEKKYIENLDVNYMIELDRKGNNDAVFYSCDNKEFIDFVTDATGYKFAYGSVSDISTLMPASKLSAVNLSSGYYNAHTTYEYVMYDEMMDTVEAARALIKTECEKPFEYVAKKYSWQPNKSFDSYGHGSYKRGKSYAYDSASGDYYHTLFDVPPASYAYGDDEYEDKGLANIARNDKELELEATVYDTSYAEQTLLATGETKAECWMNLFLDNPNLRFNDIVDYTWG
jgi:hypothetical protein